MPLVGATAIQILVETKAISATREAACMLRMNANIQNVGYALGFAAAEAVNREYDVRAVDVGVLQERLMALGILSRLGVYWGKAQLGR